MQQVDTFCFNYQHGSWKLLIDLLGTIDCNPNKNNRKLGLQQLARRWMSRCSPWTYFGILEICQRGRTLHDCFKIAWRIDASLQFKFLTKNYTSGFGMKSWSPPMGEQLGNALSKVIAPWILSIPVLSLDTGVQSQTFPVLSLNDALREVEGCTSKLFWCTSISRTMAFRTRTMKLKAQTLYLSRLNDGVLNLDYGLKKRDRTLTSLDDKSYTECSFTYSLN